MYRRSGEEQRVVDIYGITRRLEIKNFCGFDIYFDTKISAGGEMQSVSCNANFDRKCQQDYSELQYSFDKSKNCSYFE